MHLMAEISNPYLIIRTILKLKEMKTSFLYFVNDIAFGIAFIFVRMILTPLVMFYMLEGDRIILATKFGIQFILYV
jgi:hypothetical protein